MTKNSYFIIVWSIAVMTILAAGFTYRVVRAKVLVMTDEPIALPVPLKNFPLTLHNWSGEEIPIPAGTEEYMRQNFADDYLSRRYSRKNQWVDLYMVYCSTNRAGIIGHRPGVCYPAHGWTLKQTESMTMTTKSNRQIPCILQQFVISYPYKEVSVLSFYIVNGQLADTESKISGFWMRRLNLARDSANYIAHVQISSTQTSSISQAAEEMIDSILQYFPNTEGVAVNGVSERNTRFHN